LNVVGYRFGLKLLALRARAYQRRHVQKFCRGLAFSDSCKSFFYEAWIKPLTLPKKQP
jgi:hypothetical protein